MIEESQSSPATEAPEKKTEVTKPFRPNVNFGRLLFGLLIVVIGLVFLANNLGWANIELNNAWRWWPVLLIVWGFSTLTGRGWGSFFSGFISVAIILVIIAWGFSGGFGSANKTETQEIKIARQGATKSGVINFNAGAGNISFTGGSGDLVSGTVRTGVFTVNTSSHLEGDKQIVDIGQTGRWRWPGRFTNEIDLSLTSVLPFEINIDAGAANMDLDFSQVQAKVINIDTGASDLTLKLGDLVDETEVTIDAGASSVDIVLPESSGALIHLDSGLTAKSLIGFEQIDEDTYQTGNYSGAQKKIIFNLDLGATSLSVDFK